MGGDRISESATALQRDSPKAVVRTALDEPNWNRSFAAR